MTGFPKHRRMIFNKEVNNMFLIIADYIRHTIHFFKGILIF